MPRFIEKNIISKTKFKESQLLQKLVADNKTSIIKIDDNGDLHFNGAFRNAEMLGHELDNLRYGEYGSLIEKEKNKVLKIYEEIFDHQSFTGRSGTFYGYEGLGSIYWHMVSKLLLASQECYFRAIEEGNDIAIISNIKDHYYEIKAGIGLYKSPELYGAFPSDAYSHTPSNSGVKQPGLTGQVKEDVISRIAELGIIIKNGNIIFETSLLNEEEILDKKQEFEYYAIDGKKHLLQLNEKQLGFTFCQVPVVYTFSDHDKISISYKDNHVEEIVGNTINAQLSSLIFSRSGDIKRIEKSIKMDK